MRKWPLVPVSANKVCCGGKGLEKLQITCKLVFKLQGKRKVLGGPTGSVAATITATHAVDSNGSGLMAFCLVVAVGAGVIVANTASMCPTVAHRIEGQINSAGSSWQQVG